MGIARKVIVLVVVVLFVVVAGYRTYATLVISPRVTEELRSSPRGERAARVMLLTLGDGREYPVNYLQEDNKVFVGVDGRWWREFEGAGSPVNMLIRGEVIKGHAVVVLDNPGYTHDVFSRLRPTAPAWLPDWLNGKLVVITPD